MKQKIIKRLNKKTIHKLKLKYKLNQLKLNKLKNNNNKNNKKQHNKNNK